MGFSQNTGRESLPIGFLVTQPQKRNPKKEHPHKETCPEKRHDSKGKSLGQTHETPASAMVSWRCRRMERSSCSGAYRTPGGGGKKKGKTRNKGEEHGAK